MSVFSEIRYSPLPKPCGRLLPHTAFNSLGLGELTHDHSIFGKFKEIQWFPHTGLQVKWSCNFFSNSDGFFFKLVNLFMALSVVQIYILVRVFSALSFNFQVMGFQNLFYLEGKFPLAVRASPFLLLVSSES